MKKSSDELFRLISTLNKSEKGYFKKFAKRNSSSDNTSVKLFDAIEKQVDSGVYDEDAIKKKFEKETFAKQLPVAKIYLYNLILKSLNLYNAENSVINQIHEIIDNVTVLKTKGLFDQCRKLIKKAKTMAINNMCDSQYLEVLRAEKNLEVQILWGKKKQNKVKEIYAAETGVLEKIRSHTHYLMLANTMSALIDEYGMKRGEGNKEFDKLMQDPSLSSEDKPKHYSSKIIYNNIHANYYFQRMEFDKTYEYIKRQLKLIESTPGAMEYSPRDYLLVLQDIVYWANVCGLKDDAAKGIEKLKDFKVRLKNNTDKIIRILLHSRAANMELAMLMDDRKYDESLKVVKIIEQDVEKYKDINLGSTLSLFYKIAHVYYLTGDHEKALEWINRMLNEAEDDIRSDIYSFIRMLNLLVHLELGNNELLEYIIASTYRYLKSHKRMFKVETIFMNLLKRLLSSVSKEDLQNAYGEFKFKLLKIKDLSSEKAAFEYFDFLSWVESKLTGKTIIQIQAEYKNAV